MYFLYLHYKYRKKNDENSHEYNEEIERLQIEISQLLSELGEIKSKIRNCDERIIKSAEILKSDAEKIKQNSAYREKLIKWLTENNISSKKYDIQNKNDEKLYNDKKIKLLMNYKQKLMQNKLQNDSDFANKSKDFILEQRKLKQKIKYIQNIISEKDKILNEQNLELSEISQIDKEKICAIKIQKAWKAYKDGKTIDFSFMKSLFENVNQNNPKKYKGILQQFLNIKSWSPKKIDVPGKINTHPIHEIQENYSDNDL